MKRHRQLDTHTLIQMGFLAGILLAYVIAMVVNR